MPDSCLRGPGDDCAGAKQKGTARLWQTDLKMTTTTHHIQSQCIIFLITNGLLQVKCLLPHSNCWYLISSKIKAFFYCHAARTTLSLIDGDWSVFQRSWHPFVSPECERILMKMFDISKCDINICKWSKRRCFCYISQSWCRWVRKHFLIGMVFYEWGDG